MDLKEEDWNMENITEVEVTTLVKVFGGSAERKRKERRTNRRIC